MGIAGLIIKLEGIPERSSSKLKQDFMNKTRKYGVEYKEVDDSPGIGTKGITLDLSQILITFMTGGAAVALIDCMKAYLTQSEQLSYKLTAPDGRCLEINSTNVDSKELQDQIKTMVEAIFGKSDVK